MKHTKGPWKYDETWGLITAGDIEIAACHSGIKANGVMISAAPEMLEVLTKVYELISLEEIERIEENGVPIFSLMKSTILKARGEL